MNKKIFVKDIVNYCNGNLICGDINTECVNFSTDTRKIENGDTYFGLKGEKFNGSDLFEQAFEKGAKVCVLQNVEISDEIKNKYSDKSIIIVDDTLKALQQIAKYKRSLYDIPVIAVTGSVGKTSTKDIISSVVSEKYKTLKTEGNFNNHIGVPLTILRLKDEEALVVEMGMNHFGELDVLTNIAKPTIAVITNIGTAHIGNLGSRANILKAKLEILNGLSDDGTVVINNDNDLLHSWYLDNKKYNVKTFGINNFSDVMAENIKSENNGSSFEAKSTKKSKAENFDVFVPVSGDAFVYNSLCGVCIGELIGISNEKIADGIKNFHLTKNRMEIIEKNGITIINDCYNANFDSMKSSIENLGKMNGNRKFAILGDMLELGDFSEKLHLNVGKVVAENNIDFLVVVGNEAKNIAKGAISDGMNKDNVFEFNNNIEAVNFLKSENGIKQGDCALVKASNGMHFSEIVNQM